MGNFSNYWDLTTLFTKIKNKLKSISDKIDDSVSLKTATGNPITLTDAANANAEELSMTIEPVQDLHGYSKPWPAGGGKNIAHIDSTKIFSTEKDPSDPITGIADGMLIVPSAVNGYIRPGFNVSYTINSLNSITVKSPDAPGAHAYGVGIVVEIDDSKTYTLSMKTDGWVDVGWLNSDGSNLSYTGDLTLPSTLTPPSGAKYAMIECLPGRNLEHTFSNIQLEVGTSATTFEPWENICPISGLTSGEVTRVGKNLLDLSSKSTATALGITFTVNKNSDGAVTSINVNGTSEGTVDFTCRITTLKVGAQYILNGGVAGRTADYKLQVIYGDNNADAATSMGGDANFTVLPDVVYSLRIRVYSGKTVNNLTFYPMIRLATITDPTFEPYTANTATITFGQTVYGGSVNFKTGEVTVTHGMVDLGTLEYDTWSTYGFRTYDLNALIKQVDNQTRLNAICSSGVILSWASYVANISNTLKISMYKDANASFLIMGRDMGYTDAATFKTAMSGVQLCYELATPTTLTLTPAELELLKGNNTITANGAEISLSYYPDNAIGTLAGRVDDKADKEDVAVPKYDSANRREYYEGGAAFDGNIDSVPTAGSNNAVSSGGTKTYVDNAVDAIKYLTTSTTSFTDAGTKAGIQYGAEYADIIHYRIADLSTGIFMLETSGPKLGVVLFKYTNNYYSGIILNYFAMNERKPIYFVYQTGTYGIRTL